MSRPKKTYKCYSCQVPFTFEKGSNDGAGNFVANPSGSVRKVETATGQIHYCKNKKTDNISGETFEPANAVETPDEVMQTDSEPIAPKPTAPKPLTDFANVLTPAGKAIFDLIEPAITEKINAAKIHGQTVKHTVEIYTTDGVQTIVNAHRQTEQLIRYLSVRVGREKSIPNVMLVGPAGTGKTTVARMAADALGLDFYPISVGPQSTKSDFLGYVDANGRPIWTVIRDAYVNGGILLIDEMDTASAGAMTYLNSILANDVCAFPAGFDDKEKTTKERKHINFAAIAGTNTYGTGANALYNASQQLSAATLDRFIGIDWQYDTDMERAQFSEHFSSAAICPDVKPAKIRHAYETKPWGDFIWALRKAQAELGLRLVYGTRKLMYGAALLDAGFDRSETENAVVWFGVSDDNVTKLVNKIGNR